MKTKQHFEVLLNFYTKSNEIHNDQLGNFRIARDGKDVFVLSKKESFSLQYYEKGVRGIDRDSD